MEIVEQMNFIFPLCSRSIGFSAVKWISEWFHVVFGDERMKCCFASQISHKCHSIAFVPSPIELLPKTNCVDADSVSPSSQTYFNAKRAYCYINKPTTSWNTRLELWIIESFLISVCRWKSISGEWASLLDKFCGRKKSKVWRNFP